MHEKYGYVRVSSKDQNEDRQLDAMLEAGILLENIFIEKQSGKDFERPVYKYMTEVLKEDDVLFIKSIDRLGRNYREIIRQWNYLIEEKKIGIVVMDMPLLDTRGYKDLTGRLISDIVLQLLSYVAESERENIRQRQREGINAAKKRGIRFGRPEKPVSDNFEETVELWLRKQISLREAARRTGLSPSTFKRKAMKLAE